MTTSGVRKVRRYSPGGAPRVSAAQAARIDARARWQWQLDRLNRQGCDLLLAGRIEEFENEWQPLIDEWKAAQPAW